MFINYYSIFTQLLLFVKYNYLILSKEFIFMMYRMYLAERKFSYNFIIKYILYIYIYINLLIIVIFKY